MITTKCKVNSGTPGRTMDLIEKGALDISEVQYFVIDEADRLLDTGNYELIQKFYELLDKSKALQILLFSATLHSPEVRQLSEVT